MTQKEIVGAVNRLSAGYKVNWDMIKYDADNAILKINAYMGTCYPRMSDILQGPDSTYSIKVQGKTLHIFPDAYIHTIVVPFIASEILARDEEFTTIYNKYTLDVENGLFTMFSNEFNRVHPIFRQADTTGVFFAEDTSQYKQYKDNENNLNGFPEIVFTINYNINLPDALSTDFYQLYNDTNKYEWESEASIISIEDTLGCFNAGGSVYYTMDTQWYEDRSCATPYTESTVVMTSDLTLYAKWTKESTATVSTVYDTDGLHTYPVYKNTYDYSKVPELIIPDYIEGIKINSLNSDSLKYVSKVDTITLPNTIKRIFKGSFDNFDGTTINFPDDVSCNIVVDDGALNLTKSSMKTTATNLYPLILPKSITSISKNAFCNSDISVISDQLDALPTYFNTGEHLIDVLCKWSVNSNPTQLTEGYFRVAPKSGQTGYVIYYSIHFIG